MYRGWIRQYRKDLDSDIWNKPPLYHRVWTYLQLKANWKASTLEGMTIRSGMLVTSYQQIAEGVAYRQHGNRKLPNRKTIMSILKWLEGNGLIQRKSNSSGTIIYINDWQSYQGAEVAKVTEESDHNVTGKNGNGKQLVDGLVDDLVDTSKEVKNIKELKEKEYKGANANALCSMSFPSFKGKYQIPEEIVKAVEYFLSKRLQRFQADHPKAHEDKWEHLCSTLFYCDDEFNRPFDFTLEEIMDMMDRYFEVDFPDCDYSIFHFNTDGVKVRRMYETVL